MADDETTNYDATKEDVLSEVSGKDKALLEKVCLLVEAQAVDTDDAINAVYDENILLKLRHSQSLNRHAMKIIAGYAGWAVTLGIKTETLDGDGDPTEKMPENLVKALGNLNENFAQFRDQYLEQFGDEPDEPVVVSPEAT